MFQFILAISTKLPVTIDDNVGVQCIYEQFNTDNTENCQSEALPWCFKWILGFLCDRYGTYGFTKVLIVACSLQYVLFSSMARFLPK